MAKEPENSPFEKKIEEQAAATVFQLVWGWVEKLKLSVWNKVAVHQAAKSYAENYRERHGAVHVLGMAKPVPLHQIYTAVRVVSREFLGAFVKPDEMERAFREGGRQHTAFRTDRVEDGITVANREPFLNLLGAPGAGKSTFLRRLGQEAMLARKPAERIDPEDVKLSSRYDHALLPVYLELRLFKTKEIDLVARIAEEFSYSQFPENLKFAQASLADGKLLVLLDGLDEVPTDKLDRAIDHIRDFVDRHAKAGNRFVTSCRTAHYKSAFPRFTDMVVADFSDEQIEQFAGNWFTGLHPPQEETPKAFIAVLKHSANAAALELARTPLLLTFLCLTFASGQELPPTRATLYRRALDLLLREWAASKRVHDEPVYRELNADLELEMLAEFAEELFREDHFFFGRKRVTDHIRAFMELQLNAPKSLDAGKILEAIEIQQGLIVRRAEDTYSFSHLTIQEYLTAKKLWDDGELAWRAVVREHADADRWAVVFETMAGMSKADNLLRAIASRGRELLARLSQLDDSVHSMDIWVTSEPKVKSLSHAQQAGGRLIRLARDLSRALDLDRDRTLRPQFDRTRTHAFDLALDLARDFDLDLALDEFASTLNRTRTLDDRDRARALDGFLKAYYPSELNRREITEQLRDESSSMIESLTKLLQLIRLLARCRKAAYSLTSKAWDEVCDTILQLPPGE